jgi:hypothetical protein
VKGHGVILGVKYATMLCGALLGLLALSGCQLGGGTSASGTTGVTAAPGPTSTVASCATALVHYTPAPGARQLDLSDLPWVRGEPEESGLVALLWYWPRPWVHQRLTEGRIFTGGVAPAGYNVKVLWMFVSSGARARGSRSVVVHGTQLDGTATFQERFSRIGFDSDAGPPAYASIIDVPSAGCWRLEIRSGQLKARVSLRAITVPAK